MGMVMEVSIKLQIYGSLAGLTQFLSYYIRTFTWKFIILKAVMEACSFFFPGIMICELYVCRSGSFPFFLVVCYI